MPFSGTPRRCLSRSRLGDLEHRERSPGGSHRHGRRPGYPAAVIPTQLRVRASSSTAPLRDVLVKRPGSAFGRAYDDPALGFLHPVELEAAQREHDGLVGTLEQLGVTVHELGVEAENDADLCYVF